MTFVVDINMKDVTDGLPKTIDGYQAELPYAVDRAVQLTANEGVRYIVQKTPIKTGNLARGFRAERLGFMRWRISNLVKYFPFVEDDTKPHEIRPKNKKALAFPSAGKFAALTGKTLKLTKSGAVSAGHMKAYGNLTMAVVKSVHHPGTKGQHMMSNSVREINDRLMQNISTAVKNLLEGKK